MKRKLKPAAITAISALMLTSCGEGAESSSRPEDASSTAVTTVTTTAATTTVTTQISESVTTTVTTPSEEIRPADPVLNAELFRGVGKGVDVTVDEDRIVETAMVGEQSFSLVIDLSKWENHTTPKDMVQLSRLFWQSYPRMYARFGALTEAPYDVVIAIENSGYEVAEASGDLIHLHDMWLAEHPGDYDCITHELGHIVQNASSWDDESLEFGNYTELFADLCRFEYPLDDGTYNDANWVLRNVNEQDSRETSVRFLVWLDYMYSDYENGIDLMARFCDVCFNSSYPADQWEEAWQEIFRDTSLEGKTIGDVWQMYADSDFALLDSQAEPGNVPELLEQYNIRSKLKQLDEE